MRESTVYAAEAAGMQAYVIDWHWEERSAYPNAKSLLPSVDESGRSSQCNVTVDLSKVLTTVIDGLRIREPENREVAAYPYEFMTHEEKEIVEKWLLDSPSRGRIDNVLVAIHYFLEGLRFERGRNELAKTY